MITSFSLKAYQYANQQFNKIKGCEFNNAITWNGITYLIQKTFYTAIVILLSKAIAPQEFKLWVSINSGVYLLLLWIEDGIAKSIPLYIFNFIKHPKKLYSLFGKLISCYSLIFATIILSYYYFSYSNFDKFSLSLILASYFFLITQGVISILRPLFQTLSLNKNFNLAVMFSLLIKYIAIIFLVTLKLNILASTILGLNILANIIVLVLSGQLIKKIPKNFEVKKSPENSFIKHSFFMLLLTILKSATNRNALTLVAANCLGNTSFITYKIAQSSAVLFYRFKVRAMGYNGLSLLAKSCDSEKIAIFDRVLKKLILLISPLLTFTALVFINFISKSNSIQNSEFIKFFLLFSIFYIVYSLCTCYEKLVEVEQSYKSILKAYIPYLVGVFGAIMLFWFNRNVFANNFFIILTVIHFLKISSSLYIVNKAKHKYQINFPWYNLIKIVLVSLGIAVLLKLIVPNFLIQKLIK